MAGTSERDRAESGGEDWAARTRGVVDWLTAGAPGTSLPNQVLAELCRRLVACGMPLHRVAVFVATLHPNLLGRAFLWRHDADDVEIVPIPFSTVESVEYTENPIPRVIETGQALRRRLCDADCPDDFRILAELRDQGVSDYLVEPLAFTDGRVHAASWTTRAPGGFSDGQVAALRAMHGPFSRIAEIYGLKRLAHNLMNAYLGPRTGERVLKGQIKRGDGEDIHAVIWFSDLRGSTTLADGMSRPEFLAVLNRFFECMAGAVLDGGGEVLRFIGDSVLAIFPIATQDASGATAGQACAAAVAAAGDAMARLERVNAEGGEPIGFGIGLHLGDVMYGNIGVPERVEFSVIGAAANEAARLEGLTKTLGEPFLVSAEVAAHHPGPWRSCGSHALRGVGAALEVFAPADD